MNLLNLAGFLGADAEERTTANGKRVISLRLATRVRNKGADDTIWWRVNIWSDRFDNMLPYLKKGTALLVVGEMAKPETYVAKDGSTQISMTVNAEMIKFSPFGKPQERENATPVQQQTQSAPSAQFAVGAGASQNSGFSGDDLPF